ncbi:MAG TPA: RdgB/HAM1 family non-canonical purine NTP pyrophosphatase [Vicinamibacterales bacterium]|nr:RdgB/HAM1 family non-canonical purine NTP pyrophosphatase [Vicinamibacterales bacterium]
MLLATTNPGKIREIRLLLGPSSTKLATLADLPPVPEPEETGRTFSENARLKARYYAEQTRMPAIGEDSGLEIDALGGRPGVESARYPGATYPDKFRNLYRELATHPRPWTARYICAVAIVDPASAAAGVLFETTGIVEGEIWPEPRGSHGFGYDPIFYYPPYARTFGEVDDEQKLAVAHRGRAFRLVAAWLNGRTRPVSG